MQCRTVEEKAKTRHIDKLKRVLCEAITEAHKDVPDEILKDQVVTGMNGGGVGWIGEVRVAETVNGKFVLYPARITEEAKRQGWNIDGNRVREEYGMLMAQSGTQPGECTINSGAAWVNSGLRQLPGAVASLDRVPACKSDAPNCSIAKKYTSPISVVTWNCRSLWSNNETETMNFAFKISNAHDISIFTETREKIN